MEKDLSSYIEVLAYFRNLCAHDDRIYNAKCKKAISNTHYHNLLSIPTDRMGQYISGKNDILAIMIISKILLPPSEFNTIFNKMGEILSSLSKKLKTISVNQVYDQMGLSGNWYLIKKLS